MRIIRKFEILWRFLPLRLRNSWYRRIDRIIVKEWIDSYDTLLYDDSPPGLHAGFYSWSSTFITMMITTKKQTKTNDEHRMYVTENNYYEDTKKNNSFSNNNISLRIIDYNSSLSLPSCCDCDDNNNAADNDIN